MARAAACSTLWARKAWCTLRPKSSPAGAQRGRTTPSARRPALAWVYRAGLTSGYYLLPSVGFLGHAQDFRPDLDARWRGLFIAACGRAADWGLKLHAHLSAAHRRLHEAAPRQRSTSSMAALADLPVSSPT
jgi:hypothetical protein